MVAAQWTLGKAFRSVSLFCSLWHPRDGGVVVVLIGSAEFRRVWSPHWIFISMWSCAQADRPYFSLCHPRESAS